MTARTRPPVTGPATRVQREVPPLRRPIWARLAAYVVTLGILAVPAYVAWSELSGRSNAPRLPRQYTTAAQALPASTEAILAAVPELLEPGPPIVLSYHDIQPASRRGGRYTVTPEEFDRQLTFLQRAGFRTVPVSRFVEHLTGGKALPPKSMLITFDDGLSGLWGYADSILERHRMSAVAFTITGSVGTAGDYYLDWPTVEAMAKSGRWSFQAHSHKGHGRVKIDGTGADGAFLMNQEFRPASGARESVAEWQARIDDDFAANIRALERHGLGRAELFAWPFSDVTSRTDPTLTERISARVQELFPVSVINEPLPSPAVAERAPEKRYPRLEVFADTSTTQFAGQVVATQLAIGGVKRPFDHPELWFDRDAQPVGSRLVDGVLRLVPNLNGFDELMLAPGGSQAWRNYRVSATLARVAQADAEIRVLGRSPGEIRVVVGNGRVAVDRGPETGRVRLGVIPVDTSGRVDVTITVGNDGAADVAIAGSTVLQVPSAPVEASGGVVVGVQVAGSGAVPEVSDLLLEALGSGT